jgi:DNA-binding NarL/FixJ family response regulator
MPPGALRLLLVDDHKVFGESLAVALDAATCIGHIKLTSTVIGALRAAASRPFDVALIDLHLPDGDGVTVLQRLRARQPGMKAVVLSADTRPDVVRRARAAGAAAFLGKDSSLSTIIGVLRSVVAGTDVTCALSTASPVDVRLTPREQEVVCELGRGLDANEIADRLGISLHTARDHIRALLRKLDARTQLEAVVAAERLGFITVGTGS